ncbi:MAG TPA: TonB-dependent receptor, partial [Emticicia sp.]
GYGYNAEIGYRGNTEHWKWDISAFQLQYNNRMGMTYGTEANGDFYYLRTNVGDSQTNGLETYIEYDTRLSQKSTLSIFTSTAYMDARYQDAAVRVGDKNVSVKGNKVESVPRWISRNGLTFRYTKLSITALYSYTAKSYADALNTIKPNATGTVGLVPSYGLLDINATYRVTRTMTIKLNINNLTNEQYFTKRPTFYPGPGIWSSDGRSVNVTVGLKI